MSTETEVNIGASAFGFGGTIGFKRRQEKDASDEDKLAVISSVLKRHEELIQTFTADIHSLEFAYLHSDSVDRHKIKTLIDRMHYELGMVKETIEYDIIRNHMNEYEHADSMNARVTIDNFGFKSSAKFSDYLINASKLSLKKKTNFKTYDALIKVSNSVLLDLLRIIKQESYNQRTRTTTAEIMLTGEEREIVTLIADEVKFHIFGREMDKFGKEIPYIKSVKEWHVAYIRKYLYYIIQIACGFMFRDGNIPDTVKNHQKFVDIDGYVINHDKYDDRKDDISTNNRFRYIIEEPTKSIWVGALTDITFLIKSAERNNKGGFMSVFSKTLTYEARRAMAFAVFDMLDMLCGSMKGCFREDSNWNSVVVSNRTRLSDAGGEHSVASVRSHSIEFTTVDNH